MSPSALHLHFKDVTALSPLQYQKRLRLQEARRLMLGEGLDAAEAAFRVGYESPSQFGREYRADVRRPAGERRGRPAARGPAGVSLVGTDPTNGRRRVYGLQRGGGQLTRPEASNVSDEQYRK